MIMFKKRINKYIFISTEGYTFQPGSLFAEEEIENAQVIGFSKGINEKEAFRNLLNENSYLKESNFNEIICYKLDKNYQEKIKYFYIKET